MNTHESTRNENHCSDLELVREVLRGSPTALEQLIERLRCIPQILSARNVRSGSPLSDEDLTDLTQETLITVWNKLPSFEGRSTLDTWVYSFCMHQMMNALRSKKRRPQLLGDEALEFSADESRTASLGSLEYEHVHACLNELDRVQQAVIRLKHFSALTFEEIAQRLVMSESSVKTSYYRGIVRLRGLLQRHMREEVA